MPRIRVGAGQNIASGVKFAPLSIPRDRSKDKSPNDPSALPSNIQGPKIHSINPAKALATKAIQILPNPIAAAVFRSFGSTIASSNRMVATPEKIAAMLTNIAQSVNASGAYNLVSAGSEIAVIPWAKAVPEPIIEIFFSVRIGRKLDSSHSIRDKL